MLKSVHSMGTLVLEVRPCLHRRQSARRAKQPALLVNLFDNQYRPCILFNQSESRKVCQQVPSGIFSDMFGRKPTLLISQVSSGVYW